MFYSPLRYPGGKNKLAKFIANICVDNNIDGHYIEPYAGGASVALYLLIEKKVHHITINDFDRSIYAFWYCVLRHTKKFCRMIEETPLTIENRKSQKEIQKSKNTADLFTLGFSTFFLNRTNISGIINAGVIGGIAQKGNYKMDCRFNKKTLIDKIQRIASYKKNISLGNVDALDLIKKIQKKQDKNTIFYFDPPYFNKGSSLYMNHYKKSEHESISQAIKAIQNMKRIVSYDNTHEIEKLYNRVSKKNIIKYSFNHSAYQSKEGKEILFFSKGLQYPQIGEFITYKNIYE